MTSIDQSQASIHLAHPGVLEEGQLGHLAAETLILEFESVTVSGLRLSVLTHGGARQHRHPFPGLHSGTAPAT